MASPKVVDGKVCPECQNPLIRRDGGLFCHACEWNDQGQTTRLPNGTLYRPAAVEPLPWDDKAGAVTDFPLPPDQPTAVRLTPDQRTEAQRQRGDAIAAGNLYASTVNEEQWLAHTVMTDLEADEGRAVTDPAVIRKAMDERVRGLGKEARTRERREARPENVEPGRGEEPA